MPARFLAAHFSGYQKKHSPMALNEEDVVRIALLARIELNPEQRARTQAELNGLLGLIERLQSVDTRGVEPLSQPISAHENFDLCLREDTVTETSSDEKRAELLKNAPATSEGLFLVPKVIE